MSLLSFNLLSLHPSSLFLFYFWPFHHYSLLNCFHLVHFSLDFINTSTPNLVCVLEFFDISAAESDCYICGILWDCSSESHSTTHIYNIYFWLKVVVQSSWQLYNSRECGMLAWPRCVWLVACGGLSARMRSASAQCTAQAMVARSGSSGRRHWAMRLVQSWQCS